MEAAVATALSIKTRIFVTGPPGVGKTTLVLNVLQRLKSDSTALSCVQGFYTQELRDSNGARVGFEAVLMDGRKAPLATLVSSATGRGRHGAAGMPMVGKYLVDIAQFQSLVLPELVLDQQELANGNIKDLFVIDEVGKMELLSPAFFPAVWEILNCRAAAVLGTIPLPKYGREIAEVATIKQRADVAVYTLSENNREAVTKAVLCHLTRLLTI